MPEMQRKKSSFPLTSCPEPAGQGERFIVDADRDHSAPRRSRDACASSIPVPSFPNPRKKGITTLCSHKNA